MSIPRAVPPFACGRLRALLVIIFLSVGILFDLLAMAADFVQIVLLSRIMAGQPYSQTQLDASDVGIACIGLIQFAIYLTIVVLFLRWIYRAHRNLPALGAQGLRFTPGWAVGGFFVPIMNLYRPYQVVKEIWKASEPTASASDGLSWRMTRSSPLVGLWWACWIISNIVGNVVLRTSFRADTPNELLASVWATVFSDLLGILPAIFLILVVWRIDARQDEKYRHLAAFDRPLENLPIRDVVIG